MSKTQFPLPKGVEINNIEIDVKNNLLTIVYEEEKPIEKPPLGIMPMYIWKEKRREELARAITRYNTSSLVIPNEWIEELKSIK